MLPDGSSIVTGSFESSVSFGALSSVSSVGRHDGFVARINADGTYAWRTRFGGGGEDYGYAVSALADGSSIITGFFDGFPSPADFGSYSLTTSRSTQALFVAKVNQDGAFVWVTKAGGDRFELGVGVSALADGSSVVAGAFASTVAIGTLPSLTSSGSQDLFVAKLDAGGQWIWATSAGGAGGDDLAKGVSVLADGSSIVTGAFAGAATFGTLAPLAGTLTDLFVAKLDASGQWVWATGAGGSGTDDYGSAVSVLRDGSSIVTGSFDAAATFGALPGITGAGRSIFVAKVGALGQWVWATSAGGVAGVDEGTGASTRTDGSSIVTGTFDSAATFGTLPPLSGGASTVFVAKVDASGQWAWVLSGGGAANDQGRGVSALPDGSSVVTGAIGAAATFGSFSIPFTASFDSFVARVLDAPIAPTAPVVVGGVEQVTVSGAPLDGGSVTAYTVTAAPSGATCTVTLPAASCVVLGLTGGTTYTFTATATNAAGTSPPSPPSAAVTPTAAVQAASEGGGPRLRVKITSSRTSITIGETLLLTLTIANVGSASAEGTRACVTIPAGFIVVTAGGGTQAGDRVCFRAGTLSPTAKQGWGHPGGHARTGPTRTRAYRLTLRVTRSARARLTSITVVTRATGLKPTKTNVKLTPIRVLPFASAPHGVTG